MKKLGLLLIILMMIVALVPAQAQEEEPTGPAYIRFTHLAAEAPAVDVRINGRTLARSLLVSNTTDWYQAEPGTYDIAVTLAGGNTNNAAFAQEVTLEPGQWVTIATVGQPERGNLTGTVVVQYLPTEVPADQAYVTVLHGLDGVAPLNVVLDGASRLTELAYPGAIGGNDGASSFAINPGTYDDFQLILSSNGENVFSQFPQIDYVPGVDYFIGVAGTNRGGLRYALDTTDPATVAESATPLSEILEAPRAENAYIRVANLSSEGTMLDLLVDGQPVASGIEFPGASDWAVIEPGDHEIALVPTGGSVSNALIGPMPVVLSAGSWTTLSAQGSATPQMITENLGPASEERAVLTFVHAAEGVGALKIRTGINQNLSTALGYPGSMGNNDGLSTVLLTPSTYDLEVLAWETANLDPIYLLEGLQLEAGKSYVVGFTGANPDDFVVLETIVAE